MCQWGSSKSQFSQNQPKLQREEPEKKARVSPSREDILNFEWKQF